MVSHCEKAEMADSGPFFRSATSISPIFVRWNAQNRQHDFVRIFRNIVRFDAASVPAPSANHTKFFHGWACRLAIFS